MQTKQQPTPKLKRELYTKFMNGQKAEIAKRVTGHGIASTIRHFAKKYPYLEESSVRMWKNAYIMEMKRKCSIGSSDLNIKTLPKRKRGRPYLLGEELEMQVRAY